MANKESMRTLYWRENDREEVKEKERDLTSKIEDYLDDGLTYAEISKKLKISVDRVSRLIQNKREREQVQKLKNLRKLEQQLKAQKPSSGHISKERFLFLTMNLKKSKEE